MNIFITGASRGIGKSIANYFQGKGSTVIAPTRQELDLSSRKSIERYLEINNDLQPDVFVHCAGINKLFGIEEYEPEILDQVFQVNYFSAVRLMNDFVPKMKEKGEGKIVFISSLYSMITKERRIAYSSSKNALTGLMKTSALELAPSNILVNAVAPGYVMTQMTRQNLSDSEIETITKQIPTGRFQSETDIASLVYFLCSDQNKSITGQLIIVDGGYTLR